eukprot:scaffold693_cov399-Prasinococcus_capsulatus_cf.AAC.34
MGRGAAGAKGSAGLSTPRGLRRRPLHAQVDAASGADPPLPGAATAAATRLRHNSTRVWGVGERRCGSLAQAVSGWMSSPTRWCRCSGPRTAVTAAYVDVSAAAASSAAERQPRINATVTNERRQPYPQGAEAAAHAS